jgi:hypothetical protein
MIRECRLSCFYVRFVRIVLTWSRKLFRWWGRYFESRGKIDDALACYRKADDNLSLCRLLCEQDQPDKVQSLSLTNNHMKCHSSHLIR